MATTRVGVLRGGPSDEYEVSLKSGAAVLAALTHERFTDRYAVRDILIARDGTWHISGVPIEPQRAFAQADVFVNALHGTYGEDGKLQAILDNHGVAYTGSRALASAVGMNKALTKKVFKQHGIKTPSHILVEDLDPAELDEIMISRIARRILGVFPLPAVVKPATSGSSVGISIVHSIGDLEPALREALRYCDPEHTLVIIEEFIAGREATVGVIDHFRGERFYALPAVEIRHGREFFDYEAKYSDVHAVDTAGKRIAAEEIVPGHFSVKEKAELEQLARDIHAALGLRHYSRSDFIVSPRRGIYALEVNTLPGLTTASLIPKALAAVGSSLPDFLDHIIGLALAGK